MKYEIDKRLLLLETPLTEVPCWFVRPEPLQAEDPGRPEGRSGGEDEGGDQAEGPPGGAKQEQDGGGVGLIEEEGGNRGFFSSFFNL